MERPSGVSGNFPFGPMQGNCRVVNFASSGANSEQRYTLSCWPAFMPEPDLLPPTLNPLVPVRRPETGFSFWKPARAKFQSRNVKRNGTQAMFKFFVPQASGSWYTKFLAWLFFVAVRVSWRSGHCASNWSCSLATWPRRSPFGQASMEFESHLGSALPPVFPVDLMNFYWWANIHI